MKPEIKFTLDAAKMARQIIDESFQFAVRRWKQSVEENNLQQKQYWRVRLAHFMNELNWVDCQILNLKASLIYTKAEIARKDHG